MTSVPAARFAAALAAAALLAGCGSSSNASSTAPTTSTSAPAAAQTTTTGAASQTTTSGASPAPAGASSIGAAEAEAVCKSVLAETPKLSAALKAKVEGICSKAAHGNLAEAEKAGKEVCVQVIDASPIPAAQKEQALAACKTS